MSTKCLGNPELYSLYKEFQRLKVVNELKELEELRKEKELVIQSKKNIVVMYSELKKVDYFYMYNTLEMPSFPKAEPYGILAESLKEVKSFFEYIVEINNKIKNLKHKIELHYNNKINFKMYSDIVREMSVYIVEQLVKGYVLRLGCLGTIQVVRKQRKGKNINWGDSLKLKKKLQEENAKILEFSIDDNNNVINNGGEPWLLYFTEEEAYWLIWNRTNMNFFDEKNYPLYKYYNLLFTKGGNNNDKGSIKKLVKTYKTDPYAKFRFVKK